MAHVIPVLSPLLRSAGALVLAVALALPAVAQSTYPQTIPLRTLDGTVVNASLLDRTADGVRVAVDGVEYTIDAASGTEGGRAAVRDAKDQVLAMVTRGPKGTTLSDGRGTSVQSSTGTLPVFVSRTLFDANALILLDAANLALLRGRPPVFEPGLTIAMPTLEDSLCCDTGSVSNCVKPNAEGKCSASQELTACPNDGPVCEINGTWNCC